VPLDSDPRAAARPAPVTAHPAAEARAGEVRPGASLALALRPLAALLGLFLFILALQLIKSGARGLVPILDGLSIAGPLNAVGFGWLLAYVALSGSPIAAIGITLLAGGTLSEAEALGLVGGSRLGASFIVLAVGFVLYLRRRRDGDGLYIGVVALLTTFTIQGPAIALGLVSLHFGWLDGMQFAVPPLVTDWVDSVYGRPVDGAQGLLPDLGVFLVGAGVLLGSFAVFDRALPQLEGEAEGIRRVFHALNTRPLMFLMGCIITSLTLSVSISLTVLVPLSLKGYLKRDHIIPYVMGANITTFIDTLAGALILGGDAAFTVVLTEMLAVAAISAVILIGFYGPYARLILAGSHWATAKPRNLGIFLAAIVAVPAVLMLV
jgi:Na+/phosphate symporter